jgi:hypothetical protein
MSRFVDHIGRYLSPALCHCRLWLRMQRWFAWLVLTQRRPASQDCSEYCQELPVTDP